MSAGVPRITPLSRKATDLWIEDARQFAGRCLVLDSEGLD